MEFCNFKRFYPNKTEEDYFEAFPYKRRVKEEEETKKEAAADEANIKADGVEDQAPEAEVLEVEGNGIGEDEPPVEKPTTEEEGEVPAKKSRTRKGK